MTIHPCLDPLDIPALIGYTYQRATMRFEPAGETRAGFFMGRRHVR